MLLLKPNSVDPSYVYAKLSIQCSHTNMLDPPPRFEKNSLVCSDNGQGSYHIPLMEACGEACCKKDVQATGLPPSLTQQYYLVLSRTWRGRKKSAKGGRARTYCTSVRSRMWKGESLARWRDWGIAEVVRREMMASEGGGESPRASEG